MAAREHGSLRRAGEGALLGGVCAGVARKAGIDPLWVRLGFIAATMAGGFGIALYALAWALVPGEEARPTTAGRRGALEVAAGAALLGVALLLVLRASGLWFSDAVVWPLVLVAAGAGLLWGGGRGRGGRESTPAPPSAPPEDPLPPPAVRRAALVSRAGLGVALVVAAGLTFLGTVGALSAARDVVLAVLVAVGVLGVIFAPLVARLMRSLGVERTERIRTQERADLAAHLHDSVLQTLALVQKRAQEPQEVAALARRQERELRAWLSGRPVPGADMTLRAGLEAAAGEVEHAHGVRVEVVGVGDSELDPASAAVLAAAREAMVNAAKFGGGSPVDVYVEAEDGQVDVFVRDRGPGFDPAAVPPDRRGVRESILGRMARAGGRAEIRRAPGGGTEVELRLGEHRS